VNENVLIGEVRIRAEVFRVALLHEGVVAFELLRVAGTHEVFHVRQRGCAQRLRGGVFNAAVLDAVGHDVGHVVRQRQLRLDLAVDQGDDAEHGEPERLQISKCFRQADSSFTKILTYITTVI